MVIDADGSSDGTSKLLAAEKNLHVVTHPQNRGYGAALISAFNYAIGHSFDVLVTTDCDGQHEPSRIPVLVEAIHDADIVSGSRYLRSFRQNSEAPRDRMEINQVITAETNERFGLQLTDTFCGSQGLPRRRPSRNCVSPKRVGECRCSSGCRRPG